jgi:hypothetical protein
MDMSRLRGFSLAVSCACLALACDSQATPEYLGESLLSLQGQVTIEDDRTEGTLVPALAFENSEQGRLDIVDVEVEGQFPNSFSLDVYTPPPASAFMDGPPGEPRFALGYVTAVASDHESMVRFASGAAGQEFCDEEACYTETESCADDGETCYREERRCDLQGENCVVTAMSGDPSIRDDPWRSFAGLSVNYRVLYLTSHARAGSEVAHEFAGGAALAAGYNLIAVRAQTALEYAEAEACFARAEAETLAEFNAAHDRSYATLDEISDGCADDGTPCDQLPHSVIEAAWEAHDERVRAARCSHGDVYTVVAEPETTKLTIRIAPDVGPLLYL